MTRPTSHEDLRSYDRKGTLLATIHASEALLAYPSVAKHLLAALAEAKHVGLGITKGSIETIPTEAELDDRLAKAQDEWDRGKVAYTQYQEAGTFPTHNYLWSDYLAAEDITTPRKDGAVR